VDLIALVVWEADHSDECLVDLIALVVWEVDHSEEWVMMVNFSVDSNIGEDRPWKEPPKPLSIPLD
jgi:hypothetical protein